MLKEDHLDFTDSTTLFDSYFVFVDCARLTFDLRVVFIRYIYMLKDLIFCFGWLLILSFLRRACIRNHLSTSE